MSRTKQGWPLFSLQFTIVLKFLSNLKGPEIDMNHSYKERTRHKFHIFTHDNIVFLENSRRPTEKQCSDWLQNKYTDTLGVLTKALA